ncbi:MAG: metallophosphoesterase [Candidatus Omnitrophica bacterium]|nr:metallophosphoesterase [Candidatus Omnitrophota bacterium]
MSLTAVRALIIAFVVVGLAGFYASSIEPYWLEVRTITLTTDKLTRSALTVVQISDLHCDQKQRLEARVARVVNGLDPDVVVFTGDAVNTIRALPFFKATLKKIKAKVGKFAVTGNVDDAGERIFTDTGFEPLDDRVVKLEKDGDVFYISGAGYRYHNTRWREVLGQVPQGYYSIFLYHTPGLIESLAGLNVDLYLSGHIHGGQLSLPFWGAIVTFSKYGKKYESGLYRVGKTDLYVNRGIGMELVPLRFCARPEVTVFHIMPAHYPAPERNTP